MIEDCPFCEEKLYSETLKTIEGGKCQQLNCPVHGYIEPNVQKLSARFNALKNIFARYIKCNTQEEIENEFTINELNAIEGLKDD